MNYNQTKKRLQRSQLVVSGSNSELIENALTSNADYVVLDCEATVAPTEKKIAREIIIYALKNFDWKAHNKSISVRVNGLDSPYMYRDVIDIVETAGQYLDTILVPKVSVPGDIYVVDCLISQIEYAYDIANPIGIEAGIKNASGVANVEAIAKSSPRLEALHLLGTEHGASGHPTSILGQGSNGASLEQDRHAVLQRMLNACRNAGLRAIDGPFNEIGELNDYRLAAARAAKLGFSGKWVANPAQIEIANNMLSVSLEKVSRAREVPLSLVAALSEENKLQAHSRRLQDLAVKRTVNIRGAQTNAISS